MQLLSALLSYNNDGRIGLSDSSDLPNSLIFALMNQANQEVDSIWFMIRLIRSANLWFAQRIERTILIYKSIFIPFARIRQIFICLFVLFIRFTEQINDRFIRFARFARFTVDLDSIHSTHLIWFAWFASIRSASFPDSPIVILK